LHPEAVFMGPNGRADVGPSGTAVAYHQDCDFEIYETVIAVDSSHAGVAVTSIDFTAAPDAYLVPAVAQGLVDVEAGTILPTDRYK
jgi:hypothetical protein